MLGVVGKPIDILLVEDNPGDVRLTELALKENKIANNLHVAVDGIEAMKFLYRQDEYVDAPEPDVILLDLNLPRKDGREVLAEVKENDRLRHIPVVILTTSKAESDVLRSYDLQASCYVTKPIDFDEFMNVMHIIEDFWLSIVRLPGKKS